MWFKVENKRTSAGQKFIVRCTGEIAGKSVLEERPVKGAVAARKTAEILATSLNVTTTVYGSDSDGEFVYGVHEIADGAASANSAIIKQLYAESAAASLAFKDQLLVGIPEDTIRGFASMSAALGYIVAQHKQIRRAATPQISYSTLFRIFCGPGDPSVLSLPSDDATIAILTQKLADMPGWMWLNELSGVGAADRNIVMPNSRPNKVTLNIDGQLQIIRPRTVFRGTVAESGAQFMLIVQPGERRGFSTSYAERQNLNIRMGNRRMTRLTNAFSKKAANHAHMMAIYFMHYNFVRIHQTLKVTPAMAAGVTSKLWEMSDMVKVLEDWEISKN